MNGTDSPKYRYAMSVKLTQIKGSTLIATLFPHAEDMLMNSRDFDLFDDAVNSTTKLVTDVKDSLNLAVASEQFGIMSELNPKLSGKETISKEWATNELAKVWIIDQVEQLKNPTALKAVGLAQLVEVPGSTVLLS